MSHTTWRRGRQVIVGYRGQLARRGSRVEALTSVRNGASSKSHAPVQAAVVGPDEAEARVYTALADPV